MAVQDRYNLLRNVVRIANSASHSYAARLKSLTNLLTATFQLESATIYILDEERRHLSQKISSIGSGKAVNCLIPVGEGIAGRCAEKKIILRSGRESLHRDEAVKGNEGEVLAVPIPDNDRLCGVITLGLKTEGSFADEHLEALQDILVEAAGIIQRIKIAAGSNRRIMNLTVFSELGQLLTRSTPPQSLVPLILQTCHEYSGSCCSILRLLHDTGIPAGLFKKCRPKVRPHLATLLDIESDSSSRVMNSGIPLLICDLIDDVDLPPSYICVPLRFESKMLGTLTFFGKREEGGRYRNFDEEDRELFESMSMLISNTLAGAANYQRMARLSMENDKKLKESTLLYRVSNTMLSTIRLNKLIHLILTALTSGANPFFDRAMLFLINERSGVMQGMLGVTRETSEGLINPVAEMEDIQASRWDISEEDIARQRDSEFSCHVRASRLELNKSMNVASRAVLDKKLIYVPDAVKEKRVDRDFVRRFGIASFAAAPLMAKEQVVGVVIVDNSIQGRPISQDDLRFLQLFTNQAGMAIENSMLYNRIEDTNRSLREAQERLIQGERLATIGEMAAGIAHELKNPLVSIGGFARRLEKKLHPGSAESGYAETIVREVQRLEKMLTDILSFSKKTAICYNHCNITEILEDSLAIVVPALEESGVKVHRRYPRQIISFLGDCQQLKQVFINLFFNAQEAMKNGGELNITVASTKLNGKEAASVKVADTGGGIPLEALNNIFNPFYTTKETGTGLGLPIANRIVTNHGGKIQVNNHPGIGVEFNVVLPFQS
ncbi:MAG: GAF sensor signal transduction histidine [Geobacteraceae bacterium]|nr:MAG: GAF sensor signal transduction histidine [Geobacteraceae bacterium]